MEASVLGILTSLINSGVISSHALLLLIIGLLVIGYIYVFKPTLKRVTTIPSKREMNDIINDSTQKEDVNFEEAAKKLEKIMDMLDNVEDLGKGNKRNISQMRRDIESIKQILIQFQGHMMYGNRSSEFGNKELK